MRNISIDNGTNCSNGTDTAFHRTYCHCYRVMLRRAWWYDS